MDIATEDQRDWGGGGEGNPKFFKNLEYFFFFLILKNFIQKKSFIYIYELSSSILGVTLNSITLPNNLLLNSYLKNPTIELHVLYVLNMRANFYANRMLFTM